MTYINSCYPELLPKNPHINFRLRCWKFIEMMRVYSESSTSHQKPAKAVNGDMAADTEMGEPDDPSDAMDVEGPTGASRSLGLLHDAIVYGRELQTDYPDDQYRKTLDDIFSLVAYPDPRVSPHGHLLNPSGRAPVADELNSALLGKLNTAGVRIWLTV